MNMIGEILQAAIELGKSVWAVNAAEPGPDDGSIPLGWEKSPKDQVFEFLFQKELKPVKADETNVPLEPEKVKQVIEEFLPGLLKKAVARELKLEEESFSESWAHLKETVADLQKTAPNKVG